MEEITKRYLSVREISDKLRLSVETVLTRARERKIRVRLGVPCKIDVRDIDKLR